MRDSIQIALRIAHKKAIKAVPSTLPKEKRISIGDVSPCDLQRFMESKSVPCYADFDFSPDEGVVLSWEVNAPISEEQRSRLIARGFRTRYFAIIKAILEAEGYQMANKVSSRSLEKFASVYEMYQEEKWEDLVAYFSTYFHK